MAANRKKKKSKPVLAEESLADESSDLPTDRQRAFVEHYCQCWNASEAARRAGYSAKTAQEQSSRLLAQPNMQAAIQKRVAELKMGADEVLLRLAEHARGSIEDVLDDDDEFSLSQARKRKRAHLIKKLRTTRRVDKNGDVTTTTDVELHDAQAALLQLGRAHGLFIERIKVGNLSDDELLRLLTLANAGGIESGSPPAGHQPKPS